MDEIRHQDEILEMLYWMRGEGIGKAASIEQLNRFLRTTPQDIQRALQALIERRLIAATIAMDGPCYALTERGVGEGKRRFVEEFSPWLGHESHLECGEPDCICQQGEICAR